MGVNGKALAETKQFPFTAKQPFPILNPLLAVVEPVLEMENRVVEPKVAEEEPMAKAVSSVEEEARCIERRPKGEVVPTPSVPPMI